MSLDQQTNTLYDLDLRFPPLSRTVAEVSAILASSEAPDTEKLISIVNQDPLVVATVLKRINSAYYGMRRKFADLGKAVVMIGFIEVSNIVMTSSYVGLRKLGSSKKEKLATERIMRSSIGAGFLNDLIANELGLAQKPIAFISGLMHNIGRFVLLYNHPEAYIDLIEHCNEYLPSIEQERQMLGIDHAAIGAIATQHWNFPEVFPRLIESYTNPGHITDSNERDLATTIKASAEIAHQLSAEIGKYPDWNKGEEDDSEEEQDSIFPLDWHLPSCLNPLILKSAEAGESLEDVLASNHKAMLMYVENMVKQ